jgi:hypothetical protein
MMNFGEERGDGKEWREQEGNTSKVCVCVCVSLSLSLSVSLSAEHAVCREYKKWLLSWSKKSEQKLMCNVLT